MADKKPITEKKAAKPSAEKKIDGGKLAVVQVRGTIGSNIDVRDTLSSLHLYSQNYCTVINNTPQYAGMLQKAKDYITWGEIDDQTYSLLIEKRGEEFKGRTEDSKKKIAYGKHFEANGKKLKKYFRLSPPRKGYGRKGLKASFTNGGALGYRGANINDLIKRMI